MSRWDKFQYWIGVQQNLVLSDVTNATDFSAWCVSWINWIMSDAQQFSDHPPVKPPHP